MRTALHSTWRNLTEATPALGGDLIAASIVQAEHRHGKVPHGYCVIRREQFGRSGCPYAVLEFADHTVEDGEVLFHTGDYDLTAPAAMQVLADRTGEGPERDYRVQTTTEGES